MPDSEKQVQPNSKRTSGTLHYVMEDYIDDILAESRAQHI